MNCLLFFFFFLPWLFTSLHSEQQMNRASKWLKQQSQEVTSTLHFSLTSTGVSVTLYLQVQVYQPFAPQDGEYQKYYNTRNYSKYHRKVHQPPSTWLRYLWLKRNLNTVLELPFFWRREGKGSKAHAALSLTEDPVLFQPFSEHLPLKT